MIEIPVVLTLPDFDEGVNRTQAGQRPVWMGIIYHRATFLKKREYLGHTINFKTRKHFKDKKSHYVSEDEWTIFREYP